MMPSDAMLPGPQVLRSAYSSPAGTSAEASSASRSANAVLPTPIGPLIMSGIFTRLVSPMTRVASAKACLRPTKVLEPMGNWAGRAGVDTARGMSRDCSAPGTVSAGEAAGGKKAGEAAGGETAGAGRGRETAGTRSGGDSVVAPTFPATFRHRRSQAARSPPHEVTKANVTGRVGRR